MNTAHATNITPGTIIIWEGRAFKVQRIVPTTDRIVFTNNKGDAIVVNKLEEIEVFSIDHI